jgi:protein tyrosine/serine phosphatase
VTDRWLPLEGAYNARDLGGLPLADGRLTRQGVLLRTDTLQELTDADVKWLAELPLRTVVDLRTRYETDREGRGPLGDTDVAYANYSFISEQAIRPRDENGEIIVRDRLERQRVDHYLDYLRDAPDQVAAALAALAEPGATPAIFHCAAGKDRTGVLASLLLSLAGVEREAIVADYALSSERVQRVAERLRRLGTYGQGLDDVPDERLRSDPETMRDFLIAIDDTFGGVRQWVLDAGLDEGTVQRLEALLLPN